MAMRFLHLRTAESPELNDLLVNVADIVTIKQKGENVTVTLNNGTTFEFTDEITSIARRLNKAGVDVIKRET